MKNSKAEEYKNQLRLFKEWKPRPTSISDPDFFELPVLEPEPDPQLSLF